MVLPVVGTMSGKKRRRPAAAGTTMDHHTPMTHGTNVTMGTTRNSRPMTTHNNELDLPRLKGVPLYLSPLVWEAIRATRSYYYRVPNAPCLTSSLQTLITDHGRQRQQSQEAHTNDEEDDDENDVTGSILRRFAQSSSLIVPQHHQQQSEEERATAKYREAALNATKAVVDGIQTHVFRQANTNNSTEDSNHNTAIPTTDPVVTACFHHLWEKCTTVPGGNKDTPKHRLRRIAGWRAGLFLARELLLRSKDCRATIAGSSGSSDFLTTVMEQTPLLPTTAPTTQTIMAQREAVQLLELLATRYGHTHYPCMVVAHVGLIDRLVARGIQTNVSLSFHSRARDDQSTMATMGRLREQRDAALRYGDKEYNKVQRLVQRADACFPILMPRFAFQNNTRFPRLTPPPPPTSTTLVNIMSEDTTKETSVDGSNTVAATAITTAVTTNEVNIDSWHEDDEDDNDDSVDWEDGAAQEDLELDNREHQSMEDSYENHEAAVERTLAVMQNENGTGILTDGGLDIDFSSSTAAEYDDATTTGNRHPENDKDETVADLTTMDDAKSRASQVLNKCVHRLGERHMPRLARYMEGLVAADSMTFSNNTASLVVLPDKARRQRAVLLQKLMDIKGAVATVLSLATRVENVSSSTTLIQQDGTHSVDDSSTLTASTILPQNNIATASSSSETMGSMTRSDGLVKPNTLATTKTACHDGFHDEIWSMEHPKRQRKLDKNSSIKDRLWMSSLRQTGGSMHTKPFKRHISIGRNKLQIKYRKA